MKNKDAFYQLVLHPTKWSAVVNQLYVAAGKNQLYASQRLARTNQFASEARALFQSDAELSAYYNHTLAGGKRDHMMDQTDIGYTFWNELPVNNMPKVARIDVPDIANMGFAVEGSALAWPSAPGQRVLPQLDVLNQHRSCIDTFKCGESSFAFTAAPNVPWIIVSEPEGIVMQGKRIWISPVRAGSLLPG